MKRVSICDGFVWEPGRMGLGPLRLDPAAIRRYQRQLAIELLQRTIDALERGIVHVVDGNATTTEPPAVYGHSVEPPTSRLVMTFIGRLNQ